MKKKIPIGISDFKELIEENYYFVDKTLLIEEFMENSAKVILSPRPRRFGKTLNMSMMKYFFDISEDNIRIFSGLNIEKYHRVKDIQGKYPVIFISFKNLKSNYFLGFFEKLKLVIIEEYESFKFLLNSHKVSESNKEYYRRILNGTANSVEFEMSIGYLSAMLSKHYGKRVMLFIDEYDVPIQEGYIRGYYDDIILFMRNLLGAALKDNEHLEKAMVTGILRVAKESIFSGLNNLEVASLTSYSFSDKFGFRESEVEELLSYYNVNEDISSIKNWYNGYIFGDVTIYNPWSVLNYAHKPKEGLRAYWINTSANDLVKVILARGNEDVKKDLEVLVQGNAITKIIDDNIVMGDIEETDENLWSFLLFTGYLKASKKENVEGDLVCDLEIANKEVATFYKNIIKKWFAESISMSKYHAMLKALTSGDTKTFNYIIKEFVANSISYFDIGGKEPEKVYHAFVLGMLISLSDEYYVKSNRESGYGRYDVMLIPKNTSKLGIIIEFKKISDFSDDTMDEATTEALNQIEEMNYRAELVERNINKILELAVVFKGKEVMVTEKR